MASHSIYNYDKPKNKPKAKLKHSNDKTYSITPTIQNGQAVGQPPTLKQHGHIKKGSHHDLPSYNRSTSQRGPPQRSLPKIPTISRSNPDPKRKKSHSSSYEAIAPVLSITATIEDLRHNSQPGRHSEHPEHKNMPFLQTSYSMPNGLDNDHINNGHDHNPFQSKHKHKPFGAHANSAKYHSMQLPSQYIQSGPPQRPQPAAKKMVPPSMHSYGQSYSSEDGDDDSNPQSPNEVTIVVKSNSNNKHKQSHRTHKSNSHSHSELVHNNHNHNNHYNEGLSKMKSDVSTTTQNEGKERHNKQIKKRSSSHNETDQNRGIFEENDDASSVTGNVITPASFQAAQRKNKKHKSRDNHKNLKSSKSSHDVHDAHEKNKPSIGTMKHLIERAETFGHSPRHIENEGGSYQTPQIPSNNNIFGPDNPISPDSQHDNHMIIGMEIHDDMEQKHTDVYLINAPNDEGSWSDNDQHLRCSDDEKDETALNKKGNNKRKMRGQKRTKSSTYILDKQNANALSVDIEIIEVQKDIDLIEIQLNERKGNLVNLEKQKLEYCIENLKPIALLKKLNQFCSVASSDELDLIKAVLRTNVNAD